MSDRKVHLASHALFGLLIAFPMSLPMIEANSFLGRHDDQRSAPDPEFQRHLLEQMEVLLGSGHRAFTEKRLGRIEKDIEPIFAAMPKTAQGKLEHGAINYMLHRIFVQRHGWLVRSLSGEGKSMSMWNSSSSAATLLEDKVSEHVIEAFEKRMGTAGTGLHEVAILAATLEHLAHNEALDRLRTAYEAFHFSYDDVVSTEEADSIIQAYMAIYLLGGYITSMTNTTKLQASHVRKILEHVEAVYPAWSQTLRFVLDVKGRTAPERDYFYFADLANIIEEIGEHYGEFQDNECLQMKDQLVSAEQLGSPGRVRLGDFYALSKVSSQGLFSESPGYLRELGALDESDPSNPRVLVSNYVNGPSNCIASSSYYSICCRDECENLLSHLETQLSKSTAKPAELVAMVGALPSRTVLANRTLSAWLLARLDEVASHNGGTVPLHGRLFSQWMHYAYPRECPYPHVAGAIAPKKIEEHLSDGNVKDAVERMVASDEEMSQHIDGAGNTTIEDSDASMWVLEEELLVAHAEEMPSFKPQVSLASIGVRGLAFLAAVFALTAGGARSLSEGKLLGKQTFAMNEKYMV